ncbi:glycosyltransferase [Haloarcula sp. S1CR25-12]|uniref:Glycosyltransferase n=1 Tax=Haloarcula saliterrae TaxID=2950534 RepID=A0ABU2FC12_9EURY|nr:glycosyltransferase [Haloarcula sp. S1CR25-12]MDS0259779.1 glycosyltransferase [Haloarcula sp. S1CR25-12]
MVNFSVVLPTYANDDPEELGTAIGSVVDQTRRPDEILIVKDGPLSHELEATVERFETEHPSVFTSVQIPTNQGLGNALRTGVEEAAHDYVARMDADDISVPTRFEQQIDFLTANPDVDIVGGYIDEFETDPSEPVGRREVPTDHEDIERMARFRSPMNHASVIFDKETVLAAGNYRPVEPMEDYDLWVRMLLDDATFANIPEVLVNVRAGEELYGRRGGWEYAREEIRTQVEFYRRGFTSLPVFLFNTATRGGLRLVPRKIRRIIYEQTARE